MVAFSASAWSFNEALTYAGDRVRALIGDVATARQRIQNATITAKCVTYGITSDDTAENVPAEKRVAIDCLDFLAAISAADVNFSEMSLSENAGDRAKMYRQLAADLRASLEQDAYRDAVPMVGGSSASERDAHGDDADVIPARFTRDQFNHPGIPSNTAAPSRRYSE